MFDSLLAKWLTNRCDCNLKMAASILIAEDYDDNRELLRLLLEAANYEVREARDGHECLAMAREYHPDLIMIDLSMPLVDGWEVFQELQSNLSTARIPCVAVSGGADGDRKRAIDLGFSAFVSKPYRIDELLSTVAAFVGSE